MMQVYSGRLFAHLHAATPEAEQLLLANADALPVHDISELTAAVLSIFEDTEWLLSDGASPADAAAGGLVDERQARRMLTYADVC
jgi:hypothetical protein